MPLPNEDTSACITVSAEQHAELMRLAFDQICNKADWKAPIDCIVPWFAANIYMDAIEFMTATKATAFRHIDASGVSGFRLTAPGYRAGPAGP